MAEREEPDWMDEFYKKVVEDKGLTPGNDRCLLLECGHTRYVDVPHWTDGKREVGDLEYCIECADIDEKGEPA